MSQRRTARIALAIVLTACVAGTPAVSVLAAPATAPRLPSAAQIAADRARVDAAVARVEAAQQRAAGIEARAARASAGLDRVMKQEQATYKRIASRADSVYRAGSDTYLLILLGSQTLEDLNMRWEALLRMSEQDAEDARALAAARLAAAQSARSLLKLQADQARAADAAAAELVSARASLADNAQALKAYQARIAKAQAAARRAGPYRGPDQGLRGTGAWQSGLASHYSKNFSGRGASGAPITPYSMMVAHKTLPFHTLLEIEYNGRRAVASVEDRGPHSGARIFDLGPGVVRVLGFSGVHTVRYRIISRP